MTTTTYKLALNLCRSLDNPNYTNTNVDDNHDINREYHLCRLARRNGSAATASTVASSGDDSIKNESIQQAAYPGCHFTSNELAVRSLAGIM